MRWLAPSRHFQTSDDSAKPDEPYWTNSGWKRGHRSRGGGSVRLSSYEVLDSIVARFSNPAVFPNMERIVVSGHSAGGQVVHRYAASSPVDLHVSDPVRFVVANPSTYLYVTDQREWDGALIEPNRASCSDYNTWHYGMEDLNTYAEAATPDSMTTRIVRRDVVILLGDEDTGSSNLDSSCGANLQGPNRLERGRRLVRTMAELFPDSRHTQALVPGVGHSSTGMFQSEEGRAVVFRW